MKTLILKINYILFGWYYKRVGDHFRQYTFIKSVKLLIENYFSIVKMWEGECKLVKSCMRHNDELRKELSDIRIKQIAPDDVIDWANKSLGTNIRKDSEN